MTLRERVIAMADGAEGCASSITRGVALAAARMALEEAARLCREKAQHDYKMAAIAKPIDGREELRRVAMGNRCDDCADDIRYLLRDELAGSAEGGDGIMVRRVPPIDYSDPSTENIECITYAEACKRFPNADET